MLAYHVTSFSIELLAAVFDVFQCLSKPREITQCIPDVFNDTFDGVWSPLEFAFRELFTIVNAVCRAFVSCVLTKPRSEDLFLLRENIYDYKS